MKLPCSDVSRVADGDSPRDLSARRRGDQFERSGELAGNVSQISVYETDKVVTVEPSGTADVEPGLFFKYRISPFEHVIREDRREFGSLVVRLCGVMGGMMAVGREGKERVMGRLRKWWTDCFIMWRKCE